MFKLTNENQIKYTKELNYLWDNEASLLAKLSRQKLEEACMYSGVEGKHVYRYQLEGSLYYDNVEEGSFGHKIDILADDLDTAEAMANRYFLVHYKNLIDSYKERSRADESVTCSFKLHRLFTLEEAIEDNEEQAMMDEFVENELDYFCNI